jgi:hypothetical protein
LCFGIVKVKIPTLNVRQGGHPLALNEKRFKPFLRAHRLNRIRA